jgi:prepilin-type N-terminal cleavage/methylation domain-containing protein
MCSPNGRRGLTLLELVVVLVILVALAGSLVPMLPGMLSRARVAEQSANAPVHASDEAGTNPIDYYARYGVIFNLKPTTPQLVGIVAFHSDGIATGDDALQDYYHLQRQK